MGSKSAPDAAGATCPVLATAQIVSGKWTLVMLRDLAEGPCRFSELQRSLSGISPRTLSIRLRALEDEGIVERHEFAEMPPRVEYRLTPKGAALAPIVDAMRDYGARWLAEDCADHRPVARVLEAVGS
ncbi:MAG TPA: helix-turn-helix domain-containing protein [Miltoncostaeaceae bacterium]|jgi:DNA-binding HxlR family transcriptional regulator|nr:helix-turn-helix domain-containing protein [Miltoncostaeaceae bacterium]